MMGFMVGGLPRSGVTRISMPVIGVNPSRPVIQDRDTVVSVNTVTIRLVTGSAGTVCVCVCVYVSVCVHELISAVREYGYCIE